MCIYIYIYIYISLVPMKLACSRLWSYVHNSKTFKEFELCIDARSCRCAIRREIGRL